MILPLPQIEGGGKGAPGAIARLRADLPSDTVQLWSAETPQLYVLSLALLDSQGVVIEAEACQVRIEKPLLVPNAAMPSQSPMLARSFFGCLLRFPPLLLFSRGNTRKV